MQFIILVETNKKSKSDYLYIDSTVNEFFEIERGKHKFSPVYMEGKGNYNRKENKISILKNKYKNTGESEVFVCIDIDSSTNPQHKLNKGIEGYCDKKGYHYVWFNKDVEDVFIGKTINDSDKTKFANKFYSSNAIKKINVDSLSKSKPIKAHTSNIVQVLKKYLPLKQSK